MADQDDTSKPARRSRKQVNQRAEARVAGAAFEPALPALPPPQTLEEAIERVRTLLVEVRAMLLCLSEVLQYSDDIDGVMHAEVAHAAARWISDSAADLDMVKLRPLIHAARMRGYGSPGDDESGPGDSGLHQVREETAVYRAA